LVLHPAAISHAEDVGVLAQSYGFFHSEIRRNG